MTRRSSTMSNSTSCPDPAELRKLLDGSATSDEQATLARHIDGCANGQAALERLSSGQGSWADVARQLAAPAPVDSALANALDQLEVAPGQMETAAEAKPTDMGGLEFLAPAEKPGQIGKLAHYEVLERIGRGGMGIVLKAYDTKLQRIVAIKVIAPELAAQASARQRVTPEAPA